MKKVKTKQIRCYRLDTKRRESSSITCSFYLYTWVRVKLKKKRERKSSRRGVDGNQKLKMNGAFELCQIARGMYLFLPCITGKPLIRVVLLSKQHQRRDTHWESFTPAGFASREFVELNDAVISYGIMNTSAEWWLEEFKVFLNASFIECLHLKRWCNVLVCRLVLVSHLIWSVLGLGLNYSWSRRSQQFNKTSIIEN